MKINLWITRRIDSIQQESVTSQGCLQGYGDLLKDDTFNDKVGGYSVKEINRVAKDRSAGSLGYAEAMLIYYNKKMKSALRWNSLYSGKWRKPNTYMTDNDTESEVDIDTLD